jgi:hypothetical protein
MPGLKDKINFPGFSPNKLTVMMNSWKDADVKTFRAKARRILIQLQVTRPEGRR